MPRTEVTERVIYDYDELSDEAKKAARQNYVDANREYPYDNWWVFDDFVTCASLLGIEIGEKRHTNKHGSKWATPEIFFSGFSSQGDGASFTGRYRSKPDALAAIKTHAPDDEVLHRLAERLTVLQVAAMLEFNDQIEAEITTDNSNYCHSNTMNVNVLASGVEDSCDRGGNDECTDHEIKELTSILRSFADWMYRRLNDQYDWHFSDEALDGQLQDDEFTVDGDLL